MNQRMLHLRLLRTCLVAILFYLPAHGQQLTVYDAPATEQNSLHNNDFSVQVRKPGGVWRELYEYNVKVDEVKSTGHIVRNASMCSFDFSGEVEVAVKSNKGNIDSARIRPLALHISHKVKGDTLYFKLTRPGNLSVEINGDIFHNLHLFANPMEEYVYDRRDTGIIYFPPGIHEIKNRELKIPSGKTVYLAGGAVLKGRLLVEHARDVKILGRGMIDFSVKGGIRIAWSRNVLVEGLCFTQCPVGGSDSITIKNVKSISYYGWGDGLNVFASSNIFYDGVFCRNSDDCTTVYATRAGFTGGCRNITMQNATLWADVAHNIEIGLHGNPPHPDTIENLLYRNIDILDEKEVQLDYQGCMSITAGDENLVRNVRFEDIRVENIRQGRLVNLRISYNKKYCTAPGRGIQDIVFKNVSYTGSNAELSLIAGYNEERKIKNVVFENLHINGTLVYDDMPSKPKWYKTADLARFFIGEHVENVIFKK